LTAAVVLEAPHLTWSRLVTFSNFSGSAGGDVWPATRNMGWLFALGMLLPAYTITGFDASAHTAEETVNAPIHAPRGIVRSVLVSGAFGWIMLAAIVMAIPNAEEAAAKGDGTLFFVLARVLPRSERLLICAGITVAQYLCGLATVTSASRMAFAF